MMTEKLFNKSMKELVETMDKKLATLATPINLNTDRRVEASMEILMTHATDIQNIMCTMASVVCPSCPWEFHIIMFNEGGPTWILITLIAGLLSFHNVANLLPKLYPTTSLNPSSETP